jgi:hypothetical protein
MSPSTGVYVYNKIKLLGEKMKHKMTHLKEKQCMGFFLLLVFCTLTSCAPGTSCIETCSLQNELDVALSTGEIVIDAIKDGDTYFLVLKAEPNQLSEQKRIEIQDTIYLYALKEPVPQEAGRFDWFPLVLTRPFNTVSPEKDFGKTLMNLFAGDDEFDRTDFYLEPRTWGGCSPSCGMNTSNDLIDRRLKRQNVYYSRNQVLLDSKAFLYMFIEVKRGESGTLIIKNKEDQSKDEKLLEETFSDFWQRVTIKINNSKIEIEPLNTNGNPPSSKRCC